MVKIIKLKKAPENKGKLNIDEGMVLDIKIMKKNKYVKSQAKKTVKIENNTELEKADTPTKENFLDDEDQGFGGWLSSTDGMETMKLFVLANSIVMLTTLAYPHIQTMLAIISEMIYDNDELY